MTGRTAGRLIALLVTLLHAGCEGGRCPPSAESKREQASPPALDVDGPRAGALARTAHPELTPKGRMKITIGSKTFVGTLEDNASAAKLKTLLPLSLDMTELNGNEKYHRLSTRLPADASCPGKIQTGDLMLYGDDTLVLFYETFKTSYSYTRLGRVNDPSGLANALGSGEVSVTIQMD